MVHQDQRESFGDMGLLMGMGLILVYVMVAQFESWTRSFCDHFSVHSLQLVLSSLIGRWHKSLRHFFSGLIILIELVVNNAIVLIDYIKLLRERGMELIESIKVAGGRRLRPVLIVSNHAGGMLPLALTTGGGTGVGTNGKNGSGWFTCIISRHTRSGTNDVRNHRQWQLRGTKSGEPTPVEVISILTVANHQCRMTPGTHPTPVKTATIKWSRTLYQHCKWRTK